MLNSWNVLLYSQNFLEGADGGFLIFNFLNAGREQGEREKELRKNNLTQSVLTGSALICVSCISFSLIQSEIAFTNKVI